jgi:2-amino-4-hydroxy-6-hydroxymethyldihydropteridine diphosphokinase
MQTNRVYIGLGTNLGDRLKNLDKAISYLTSIAIVQKMSKVYETEPWGLKEQPFFLNQVIKCVTSFEPIPLLKQLKTIEKKMRRVATIHYGPRIIDLDILFYNNIILETPELTIPHPMMAERAFVLIPLAEIAPNLIHPKLHKTITELMKDIDINSVRIFEK